MYLCLTALIQLNLLSTRNPSFWWRFTKHTSPRWVPRHPLLNHTKPGSREQMVLCRAAESGMGQLPMSCPGRVSPALFFLGASRGAAPLVDGIQTAAHLGDRGMCMGADGAGVPMLLRACRTSVTSRHRFYSAAPGALAP